MKYFLDTNICIYALKNTFPRIGETMRKLSPKIIAIPAMVKAELYYGAFKSVHKERTLIALEKFLSPFKIIPFGDREIKIYAKIRADLEQAGKVIGPNDLIIAATALSHGAVLITHNTKEFSRIDELLIEDWTQ